MVPVSGAAVGVSPLPRVKHAERGLLAVIFVSPAVLSALLAWLWIPGGQEARRIHLCILPERFYFSCGLERNTKGSS